MLKLLTLPFLNIILFTVLVITGCNNDDSGQGKQLSKQYCSSCHAYPEPSLLPQNIWKNNILPEMAAFANLYKDNNDEYHPMTDVMIKAKDPATHHLAININKEEWDKIINFYLHKAPEQFPANAVHIDTTLNNFDVLIPEKTGKAYTSSIYFDHPTNQIVIANMMEDSLKLFNSNLRLTKAVSTAKGIVDISSNNLQDSAQGELLLTHIGSFKPLLPPINRRGSVELLNLHPPENSKIIADSLDRPVKTIYTDVNKDGLKDLVVCEFGFLQGYLSLFVNNGKGYTKKILSPLPGAIQIYEDDINKDGLPDFWVLFAGAYEGIVQFINKGNTEFEQVTVASFPPSYGSTYFELVDFNKDGKKDIVYTCGDNADNSQVLKPYHGIYLFENTDSSFKQTFFFPMNGCYKATMADYDLDGDLDIAAIAFFADYEKHPEQGFVYLNNDGKNNFSAHTFPQAKMGRWICMEAVDYDGDGDTDILIGNLAAKPGDNRDLMLGWINGPNFIVLRNRAK